MACIDHGASIVDALQNLGRPRISCLGHNLHLVVSHGLDSDKDWDNPFNLSLKKFIFLIYNFEACHVHIFVSGYVCIKSVVNHDILIEPRTIK